MLYRKEIDGLRAIAVLTVIFFHAGFESFSGGFIGVDIFFVISGYLITSIIFKEITQGTFTIKDFYERRARRILPALFFIIAFSIPLSYLWMVPSDAIDFSQSLIAAPLFSANFLFFTENGYFDTAIEFKPLFHTWSLAVEEQFYVFFPLLIMSLWKFGFRVIIFSILILFLTSISLSEYMLRVDKMFSFYMLPTRGWQLLIGSSIAILQYKEIKFNQFWLINNFLSLLGLAMIVFSVTIFDKTSPMPGLYSLVPTIGSGLVIMFAQQNTLVRQVLSIKMLVGIGLISYSAYLWHQPIFAIINIYRFGDVKPAMYGSAILVTLLLSYFTWKFVETPFRNKLQISLKKFLFIVLTTGLVIIFIGLTGIKTNGFEKIYKNKLTTAELLFYKNSQEIAKLKDKEKNKLAQSECILEYSNSSEFNKKFNSCRQKYHSFNLIIGDSHAENLSRVFTYSENDYDFSVLILGRHCHVYHYYQEQSKSQCDLEKALSFIDENYKDITQVIYKQRGVYFIHDSNKKNIHDINLSSVKDTQLYIDELKINHIIDFFNKLKNKIKVIWIGPWTEPLYPMHKPRKVSKYTNGEIEYISNVSKSFNLLDQRISNILKKSNSNIAYVSLHNDGEFIPLVVKNCITFNDTNHLSSCGERLAAPIIDKVIKQQIN